MTTENKSKIVDPILRLKPGTTTTTVSDFKIEKGQNKIGRASSNNIYLKGDPTVSNYHASLDYNGTFFILKDLNSLNKTLLQYRPNEDQITLKPNIEYQITNGSKITFGSATMVLSYIEVNINNNNNNSNGKNSKNNNNLECDTDTILNYVDQTKVVSPSTPQQSTSSIKSPTTTKKEITPSKTLPSQPDIEMNDINSVNINKRKSQDTKKNNKENEQDEEEEDNVVSKKHKTTNSSKKNNKLDFDLDDQEKDEEFEREKAEKEIKKKKEQEKEQQEKEKKKKQVEEEEEEEQERQRIKAEEKKKNEQQQLKKKKEEEEKKKKQQEEEEEQERQRIKGEEKKKKEQQEKKRKEEEKRKKEQEIEEEEEEEEIPSSPSQPSEKEEKVKVKKSVEEKKKKSKKPKVETDEEIEEEEEEETKTARLQTSSSTGSITSQSSISSLESNSPNKSVRKRNSLASKKNEFISSVSLNDISLSGKRKSVKPERLEETVFVDIQPSLLTTPSSPSNCKRPDIKLLFSMFSEDTVSELESICLKLGGTMASNSNECTHLVSDEMKRSKKILECISYGKQIVTSKWLKDSKKSGKFLDESPYHLSDKKAEQEWNFNLEKSLSISRNRNNSSRPLFNNMLFYITKNSIPPKDFLKEIIEINGGEIIDDINEHIKEQDEDNNNNNSCTTIIIANAEKDKRSFKKWSDNSFKILKGDFILLSILSQHLFYEGCEI